MTATRELVAREHRRDPGRAPLVVLLTDGRSSDPQAQIAAAAARLAATGATAVVVDCEEGSVRLGLARQLAAQLGARRISLADFDAATAANAANAATARAAATGRRRAA